METRGPSLNKAPPEATGSVTAGLQLPEVSGPVGGWTAADGGARASEDDGGRGGARGLHGGLAGLQIAPHRGLHLRTDQTEGEEEKEERQREMGKGTVRGEIAAASAPTPEIPPETPTPPLRTPSTREPVQPRDRNSSVLIRGPLAPARGGAQPFP